MRSREENQGQNIVGEQNTEGTLQSILQALGDIQEFSENDRVDQNKLAAIRRTVFKLHTMVTSLAYKVGKLEKENCMLSQKMSIKDQAKDKNVSLSVCPNTSIDSRPLINKMQNTRQTENSQKSEDVEIPKRTYSTIAKTTRNKNRETDAGEKWVTPPQPRRHETLIRLKEQDDPKKVLREIKQNLNKNGNFTETFKSIKQLHSGGVIVECHSDTQQKILQKALENHGELQIREKVNTDPMLMITGVEKGYNSEDFINGLVEDNPQIKVIFGEDVGKKIYFITKKECRNKTRENWVLQTNPEVFKWLIRNENLIFDLTKAYVQEYTNIAMCFKCCCFGHVAKYCKGEVCCHKCGQKHEGRQCPENTLLDCPNCKRLKLDDRIHSARDPNCPAFLRKLNISRQYTNYDTNKNRDDDFLTKS